MVTWGVWCILLISLLLPDCSAHNDFYTSIGQLSLQKQFDHHDHLASFYVSISLVMLLCQQGKWQICSSWRRTWWPLWKIISKLKKASWSRSNGMSWTVFLLFLFFTGQSLFLLSKHFCHLRRNASQSWHYYYYYKGQHDPFLKIKVIACVTAFTMSWALHPDRCSTRSI